MGGFGHNYRARWWRKWRSRRDLFTVIFFRRLKYRWWWKGQTRLPRCGGKILFELLTFYFLNAFCIIPHSFMRPAVWFGEIVWSVLLLLLTYPKPRNLRASTHELDSTMKHDVFNKRPWPNWIRHLTTNQGIGGSSPPGCDFLP